MIEFVQRDVRRALAWSAAGGQALHMMTANRIADSAPRPFHGSKYFGHLLDQDTDRLMRTARRFGLRRIFIHHEGEASQHVDLYGSPLQNARRACKTPLFAEHPLTAEHPGAA